MTTFSEESAMGIPDGLPNIRKTTSKRVLIAEDDPSFRKMLASTFSSDGYDVVAVGDGIDLLYVLGRSLRPGPDAEPFDIVVSDVRMPGLTGIDAITRLGAQPPTPPVVLITAFGDDELHARARASGAVAILDKPLDVDDLLILANHILDHRN